jgi:hypothetical protein
MLKWHSRVRRKAGPLTNSRIRLRDAKYVCKNITRTSLGKKRLEPKITAAGAIPTAFRKVTKLVAGMTKRPANGRSEMMYITNHMETLRA